MKKENPKWCLQSFIHHFNRFSHEILQINNEIGSIGGIVWPLLAADAVVWLVVYVCIMKGAKSVDALFIHQSAFISNWSVALGLILGWQSGVLQRNLSICYIGCAVYSWYHVTGRCRRHTVLHHAEMEWIDQFKGIILTRNFSKQWRLVWVPSDWFLNASVSVLFPNRFGLTQRSRSFSPWAQVNISSVECPSACLIQCLKKVKFDGWHFAGEATTENTWLEQSILSTS